MVTPAFAAPAPTEPEPVPAAAEPSGPSRPLSRPDAVAAAVTARASGVRVEVEGLRDEFSMTFANPGGTFTREVHGGQQRFRDEDTGQWRDVDLDLVSAADGSVAPKGHPLGLRLSGASAAGGDVAAVDAGRARDRSRRSVSLAWPGRLGKPVLSGPTATYREVRPGVDLVVESRRTGFEQHFVVKDAAAAAAGSWSYTVKTRGLTARSDADGGVSFVDEAGEVASRVPPAFAWDAAVDPRSGEPASMVPVALGVAQKGAGRATLTLTPPAVWLGDPGRVFPVTVDPTYAAGSLLPSFDTYVQSNVSSTDYSSATELRVGTHDGSTVSRSFLNFNLGSLAGLQVMMGSLSLYQTWSYSCGARTLVAYQSKTLASTATRWSNQPAVYSTAVGSTATARGYSSSCPAGRVNIDVTALVQAWAGASGSASGIALRAGNEADVYGWARFASLETSYDPVLSYTYNRRPDAAVTPSPSTGLAYGGVYYVPTARPRIQGWAKDPDQDLVALTHEVHSSTAGTAASKAASCATPMTASGALASCDITTTLADNTEYYVRTAVKDKVGAWNGTWSPWRTIRVAAATPAAPVISCPGRAHDSWTDAAPAADVACTVTGAATGFNATTSMTLSVDGADVAVSGASWGFTVSRANGMHAIKATARSNAGLVGEAATHNFGYGPASLTSPTGGSASNGKFRMTAAAAPRGSASSVTASVQWRRAGVDEQDPGESAGWNEQELPAGVIKTGLTSSTSIVTAEFVWDSATATTDTTTTPATELSPRVPVRLDVQVCFTYTGVAQRQCTWSEPHNGVQATVLRIPHAFGAGFPTAGAGPGQVALWTGEFNASATDVTVPAYTGTLSLSRSHSTYDGTDDLAQWPALPGSGVLGPGWTLGLDGSDLGEGGLTPIDNSLVDGTIAFVDGEGSALVFAPTGGVRRKAGQALAAGLWAPVDDDTAAAGVQLTVADTAKAVGGVATAGGDGVLDLVLRDEDGTSTTFIAKDAPGAQAGTFVPGLVDEPGQLGATVYSRDGQGRVTRILAPAPPGVACPATGALPKGCRALVLTYATATGTPADPDQPRDVAGQLAKVEYHAWDPAAGAMALLPVAAYQYDARARLVAVTDSRSELTTRYSYAGDTPRLATVTPPGLAAYRLAYADSPDGVEQLAQVRRDNPDGSSGSTLLASFVYGLTPAGDDVPAQLPSLRAGDVDDWQQHTAPTYGAAVFTGPDDPGTHLASGVPAGLWRSADLRFTDAEGHTVNTASYGAGAWQVTASDYDQHGNVIRSLGAGAIAAHAGDAAAAGLAPEDLSADPYASLTQYNAEEKLTADLPVPGGATLPAGTVVSAAGSKVVNEWGPQRQAMITVAGAPQLALVRPHTRHVLDEGAPNNGINPASGQRYNLVTTTITGAAETMAATTAPDQPGAGDDVPADIDVISVTLTGYDARETTDKYGPTSGWTHSTPTRTTQILAPSATAPYGADPAKDIVADTVLDTEGRATQARQPSESGGATLPTAGPGTIVTTYYTAATGDATCGGKPQWAGLVCRVAPAVAGGAIASTTTEGYTAFLAPTKVIETGTGGAVRTTVTTYDAAGRPIRVSRTLDGFAAGVSQAVPDTVTAYDPATGLPVSVTDVDGAGQEVAARTITTGYDAWGRATTYTAAGQTTTTAYDAAGRVASVADPKGATTYTYDGPDAAGDNEHRGLPTRVTTTTGAPGGAPGPGPDLVFTGAYDPDGRLVLQTLPGGLRVQDTYDAAGEPTARVYTGPDGAGGQAPWLAWSQANDVAGRVAAEHTPNAAVFTDGVGDGSDAAQYHRQYTYDGAGRLTLVADRTAAPDALALDLSDPANVPGLAGCVTRAYTFNRNGARTQLEARAGQAGQACPTAGTGTVEARTWTVDSADKANTATRTGAAAGTYLYDGLGRVTTLPAVDSAAGADVSLRYRADDSAWTIATPTTGGTLTQEHAYDAGRRRILATTTDTSKPTGAQTSTLARVYTDTSDNPAWTISQAPGQTSEQATTTRYIAGLGGALAATATQVGAFGAASVQVMLANLHGDITTTTTIPATGTTLTNAAGIDSWNDTDEYGNLPAGARPATPANYGWLGTKERSAATPASLTLMGARLYNASSGLFTSVDPIYAGNDNAYSYPNDPINNCDASGEASCEALVDLVAAKMAQIAKRQQELRTNKHNQPIYGRSMTIESHVKQAKNYQQGLRNNLMEFQSSGCGRLGYRLPSSAWKLATVRVNLPRNIRSYGGARVAVLPGARTGISPGGGMLGIGYIGGGGAGRRLSR